MLLPIGVETTAQRKAAVVVYSLIAINLLIFLFELGAGEQFIDGYAVIPYEITHGLDLVRPVHIYGNGVVPQAPGPYPIYLTLLTAMFMHGGFLHIAGNMLYLWVFGRNLENGFGHLRFLLFYLLCGLAAAFAQILMDPDSVLPSLGASGAIAGVLGGYIALFPSSRIRVLVPFGFVLVPFSLPAVVVIGFWIVLQFFDEYISIVDFNAQTQNGGIAYMAHIGGFIAGLILSVFFRRNGISQPSSESDEALAASGTKRKGQSE
jgi:rhomboid family protein